MPYYALRAFGGPVLINDTNGYMVVIAGQPVTALAGTLSIECAVGKRSQASFQIYTASLATHIQQYQQVQIYDKSNYLVFSGYVTNPKEVKPGSKSSLRTEITCADQHFLADKRIVAAAYENQTPARIVTNILNNVLAAEGVTIGQIYDPNPALYVDTTTLTNTTTIVQASSQAIPHAVFGYCTAAQALDALTEAASASGIPYYWQIDQLKRLFFVPYTQITGPSIDGTQIEHRLYPPSVVRANPTYRNTQYVVGGVAQTVQQVATRIGDGNTTTWTMNYDLAAEPGISVDGVAKTVGINGVETGKDFYWNKGSPVITQDTSGVKLLSSNTLQVTYIGQYPTVASTNNAAQVSYQASLDGSTGIIEDVQEDASISSLAGGYQEANNLLTRYGQQGVQLQCTTMQSGFVQGQLCSVNLPMFGINHQQMLLESVTITDSLDGINVWYVLNLISGPYDTTWEAFFGKLIGNTQPLSDLSVGASQSLALLASFTASLTPTASYTATVYACPIVSTGTLCGTGTIVC